MEAKPSASPFRNAGPRSLVPKPVAVAGVGLHEVAAWWPNGPIDPEVRVLRVIPESAEYWDTRGNSVTVAWKLAAARLSGGPPDLGENKKVRLR